MKPITVLQTWGPWLGLSRAFLSQFRTGHMNSLNSKTRRLPSQPKRFRFNAMTNVTVTVELANGKTIIGRNMWTVEAQEVKTAEATFEVKWEGFSVEEA